jgi:hypothetical protein
MMQYETNLRVKEDGEGIEVPVPHDFSVDLHEDFNDILPASWSVVGKRAGSHREGTRRG